MEMDLRLMVQGSIPRRFHLECQSTADGSMILRVIRYDLTAASEEAEFTPTSIRVHIDDSGVLFLRSTKSTPDVMRVEMILPQNQTASYQIPVLRMRDYTLDQIFEKELFILLPFYFFNHEKQLRIAVKEKMVLEELQGLYDRIFDRLKQLADEKRISAYEANILFESLKMVLASLGKTGEIEEEVEKIMGGKILTFEADKYYDAGVADGKEKTETRDNLAGIRRAMKKLNYTPEKAMDFMDIPISEQPKYALMLKESSGDMISESDGKISESMKF